MSCLWVEQKLDHWLFALQSILYSTGWTTSLIEQNSEDQKCFICVTVKDGDRVINVKCTKQDVIALSGIHFESFTMTTGELERVPSEDNGTKCLKKKTH